MQDAKGVFAVYLASNDGEVETRLATSLNQRLVKVKLPLRRGRANGTARSGVCPRRTDGHISDPRWISNNPKFFEHERESR